jgi:hypothetical protein
MAVLASGPRLACAAELMQQEFLAGVLKADVRAAINAIDDYLNTNATSINSAIPQPARAALTTTQKAKLLQLVVQYRYVNGS